LRANVRKLHHAASRDALPGALTNFTDQDDNDAVRQFGTENAGRLAALRRTYGAMSILQN
jgi:hypothetical protein